MRKNLGNIFKVINEYPKSSKILKNSSENDVNILSIRSSCQGVLDLLKDIKNYS
jgi:hypothetical protein